jgi:pyrimidine deaminase RibD-like protein
MLLATFAGAIMLLHLYSLLLLYFRQYFCTPNLIYFCRLISVLMIDPTYMHRCLQLARLGEGHVAPNPVVGAVLVCNDLIIGEGYHKNFGGPHAEVECINSVNPEHQHLIEKSTLYVSLEPCAHFGKTPPCTNLIIEKASSRSLSVAGTL